jgi:hypothetical protein
MVQQPAVGRHARRGLSTRFVGRTSLVALTVLPSGVGAAMPGAVERARCLTALRWSLRLSVG